MFAAVKYKCFVCRKDGMVKDDGWTKCVGGESRVSNEFADDRFGFE